MTATLQVMLNHFDVADGEISYEVAVGQYLIYPIEIETFDANPLQSVSNQYGLQQIENSQYNLKGQVIEIFQDSQIITKCGVFIFYVEPFYFIGRMSSKWSNIQVGDWLYIHGQFRLNGWDFGPRRPLIEKNGNNLIFSKRYSPHHNPSTYIYQLYKVASIQRYIEDHNANKFIPTEYVQQTDIQQKALNDDGDYDQFLLTLEFQNENGLEAVNRILDTGKDLDTKIWNLA